MNTEGQLLNDVGDVVNAVSVDASNHLDAAVSVGGQPTTVATPIKVDPKTAAILNVVKAVAPAIEAGHASFEGALMGILAAFGVIRF